MNSKKHYAIKLIILSLFLTISSCDDDYSMYSSNNGSNTATEISSLEIRPGINMVSIEGKLDDANMSEVKIYWDNKSQSVTVPVTHEGEENSFATEINNLDEKLHIFEILTVDSDGNNTELASGGAKVYGETYLSSIENREIVTSELKYSLLNFTFNPIALTTGILGTEIIYTNDQNEEIAIFNSTNNTKIAISDFKSGSTLKYRTAFKYSPLALDTIYTDYTNHKPFVLPILQNAAVPYIAEEAGSRWGNLGAPWITNDAAKNHGGYGGWDQKNGNIFNLESGWGAPEIVNGKVYQTISLEPATYQLKVTVTATNHSLADEGGAYFVISSGNGLPDVEDLNTATGVLGYERIESVKVYSVEFTVAQASEVSFGELTTQSTAGRYCNIKSWELVHVQ